MKKEIIKNAKPIMINASEGIAQPMSEPQFKEGEIDICEIVNAQSVIDCDRFFYMGFLFGKHWGMVNTTDKTMYELSYIRKIDPDKELKELADELVQKYVNKPESYNHLSELLIEAMKKVQSKK